MAVTDSLHYERLESELRDKLSVVASLEEEVQLGKERLKEVRLEIFSVSHSYYIDLFGGQGNSKRRCWYLGGQGNSKRGCWYSYLSLSNLRFR